MTGRELWAWRKARYGSQEKAAAALGVTRITVAKYEARPTPVPIYIALSVAAIEAGLSTTGARK